MGFYVLTYRHDTGEFYDLEGVVDRPRDEIDRAAMIYTEIETRIQSLPFHIEARVDGDATSFFAKFSEDGSFFTVNFPAYAQSADHFDFVAEQVAQNFGRLRYLKNK